MIEDNYYFVIPWNYISLKLIACPFSKKLKKQNLNKYIKSFSHFCGKVHNKNKLMKKEFILACILRL